MRELVYNQVLKAYESNDVELFNELNRQYSLGLTSIDEVELIEDRPTLDLSKYYTNYNAQYMKNYTTSRFIVNIEPLHKHILKKPEFNIVSYSYMIYHVLTGLMDNPNLDEVLDNVDLQFSGDAAKNILLSKGFIELHGDEAEITSYGLLRLAGVSWVNIYETCLDYFDFDDFERYMQENDTGKVIKNAFNYLDEHLKIALERKEFHRLHDVFSSKAMLYIYEEEFKKALIEELKIFIIKLNALYLDKSKLDSFYVIEFPNINNIAELNYLSEAKSLKRVLFKGWFDLDLDDEMVMSKKEAFSYLSRALDGEIVDVLAEEVMNKYLTV